MGNWVQIKEENEEIFGNKTRVHLKDKYRNLEKPNNQAHLAAVKELAKKAIEKKRKLTVSVKR
jgi:hypothetical protein